MRPISVGQPSLGGNEKAYVLDVLEREWLTMGHYVLEFEARFARYVGVKHAVAVKSGTAALHLALTALGIGPGDEVIVPALTFVATANAVVYTGATPVIADVDEDTWCLGARGLVNSFSERTAAILPVHLYGAISRHTLSAAYPVIEDACEALGAEKAGRKAGALGKMGCFSFYGNKTITTGEGGMVTTDDDELADKLRWYRSECMPKDRRFWHDAVGFNYVMTDLQGAVGCAQMERLGSILEWRAGIAADYRQQLDGEVTFQVTPVNTKHGNWSVTVLLPEGVDRDIVAARLKSDGIETRPMFYPLNTLPMWRDKGYECPVAEKTAPRGLMLPTHAELTADDVTYVCDHLKGAIHEQQPRRYAVAVAG